MLNRLRVLMQVSTVGAVCRRFCRRRSSSTSPASSPPSHSASSTTATRRSRLVSPAHTEFLECSRKCFVMHVFAQAWRRSSGRRRSAVSCSRCSVVSQWSSSSQRLHLRSTPKVSDVTSRPVLGSVLMYSSCEVIVNVEAIFQLQNNAWLIVARPCRDLIGKLMNSQRKELRTCSPCVTTIIASSCAHEPNCVNVQAMDHFWTSSSL